MTTNGKRKSLMNWVLTQFQGNFKMEWVGDLSLKLTDRNGDVITFRMGDKKIYADEKCIIAEWNDEKIDWINYLYGERKM